MNTLFKQSLKFRTLVTISSGREEGGNPYYKVNDHFYTRELGHRKKNSSIY